MKTLIVEDDSACRLLLVNVLSRYSECHTAVNGKEGVEMFRAAADRGSPFDLVCMDILMPVLDGQEAIRQMRALEAANGVLPAGRAKIIMTTSVHDMKEVARSFMGLCDAYLVKPIGTAALLRQMWSVGFF